MLNDRTFSRKAELDETVGAKLSATTYKELPLKVNSRSTKPIAGGNIVVMFISRSNVIV